MENSKSSTFGWTELEAMIKYEDVFCILIYVFSVILNQITTLILVVLLCLDILI